MLYQRKVSKYSVVIQIQQINNNLPLNFQFLNMSKAQTKTLNVNEEEPNPLHPLFKRYPPNEILNHKYAPDSVPQVKLITNKDARFNNVPFVPPKAKNRSMERYAQQFNFFDYLGHHYSKMINQIVYMKFDNSKNSLLADAKLRTRVMPAFYLPFQQLYSEQPIQFTQRLGLQFPVMQTDSYLPTRDNNRGCSFDPLFGSAFESANLFAALRKKPFQYDLILQSDTNSCDNTGWFNFSVQFQEQGYYTFRIVNITTDMSQLFARGLKISYFNLNNFEEENTDKVGENWGLCGENIQFSESAIEMQNKRGQKYYELYFEYKCKNKHDAVIFALDLPYNTMEAAKFYDKLLTKRMRGMITIEKEQYGTTIQGSPLNSFTISRKKTGDTNQLYELNRKKNQKRRSANFSPFLNQTQPISDGPNKSIIIIGRVNGADISSSFVIEGMVEYLFQNMEFDSLKRIYNFYFFPFTNVDGVKYGNNTANLTGSNLNGNWKDPHKQYQPEIYYLKEYMNEINKKYPISLVINLTGEHQNLYTSIIGVNNNAEECEDSRIYPYILSKRNRIISFEDCAFMDKNQNNSMCCILSQLYPKTLVYQFNISRFCTVNKMDDLNNSSSLPEVDLKQCNGDNYRSFGRQLIYNYLEHVRLYGKNVLLRDKWGSQIQGIESKITRKSYNFVQDKKTEDRFQEVFYRIIKDKVTESKIISTISSNFSLNSKKVITQPVIASLSMQKQQLTWNKPINSLKDARKKSEGYLKNNMDSIKENVFIGKPLPRLRSNVKKTSILNNCNTLEQGTQISSQHLTKRKKDRLFVTKDLRRKQTAPDMFRKVKIQNNWKGRINRQKLQQALQHS